MPNPRDFMVRSVIWYEIYGSCYSLDGMILFADIVLRHIRATVNGVRLSIMVLHVVTFLRTTLRRANKAIRGTSKIVCLRPLTGMQTLDLLLFQDIL